MRIGLGLCKVVPLPSNIVEDNVVEDQSCLQVEHCPFCGLGFESLWARQITFCKHVYHVWCAHVHFQMSTKCNEALCGEEMHDGWSVVASIQNLGMNHNSNSLKVFHLSGKVWHEYLLSPFL